MKNVFSKFNYLFVLLSIIVFLMGCKTREVPVSKIPEFYSWDEITKEDKEDTGYGLYTYVLFGKRVDNLDALGSETRGRYLSLLDAVISSPDYGGREGTSQVEKELSNVFYLPAQIYFRATGLKPKAQYYAKEIYDSGLSKYLLTVLGGATEDTEIRQQITSGPGPFLISTLQPIGQYLDKGFPHNSSSHQKTLTVMLIADLSETSTANMKEIVSTYRCYVRKETNGETGKLKPLQLSLLNLVLNTNNNLQIVKITL